MFFVSTLFLGFWDSNRYHIRFPRENTDAAHVGNLSQALCLEETLVTRSPRSLDLRPDVMGNTPAQRLGRPWAKTLRHVSAPCTISLGLAVREDVTGASSEGRHGPRVASHRSQHVASAVKVETSRRWLRCFFAECFSSKLSSSFPEVSLFDSSCAA